jgi:hypothetical protein
LDDFWTGSDITSDFYAPPEYLSMGRDTLGGDVYAMGCIGLEVNIFCLDIWELNKVFGFCLERSPTSRDELGSLSSCAPSRMESPLVNGQLIQVALKRAAGMFCNYVGSETRCSGLPPKGHMR